MRVLYFYEYFNTRAGYAATRCYEFSRHLVEQGHEVTVVTGESEHAEGTRAISGEEVVDGIRVRHLPVGYSQELGTGGRMRSFVEYAWRGSWDALGGSAPDVVYATSTPLTAGIPGYVASRRHRVPFVFEVRDLWPEVPAALGYLESPAAVRGARWLERALYASADALVALSPAMGRGMVAAGADPDKITVIPNMADLELFDGPRREGSWRAEAGIPEDAVVVVHPGAMGYVNDLSQVLDAAALVDDPRIYFALVGMGSERDQLEDRVRREGLERVLFPPPLPRSEMPWVLAGCDVGLLVVRKNPALYANSANKFGDFLAAGLPVVVTYPGWQGRLLDRYGAGIVADGGAEDLAQQIRALADDPAMRSRLGGGARRLAEERLSRDLAVEAFTGVLQGVLEDGGRR